MDECLDRVRAEYRTGALSSRSLVLLFRAAREAERRGDAAVWGCFYVCQAVAGGCSRSR